MARAFGWLLVVSGLVVGLGYPVLAARESNANVSRWVVDESRSMDSGRVQRVVEMTQQGLVPAWTQVSPWPGVAAGGVLLAFGAIALGTRPRERSADKSGTRC